MVKLFLYTHLFCAFSSLLLLLIRGRLQITGRNWREYRLLRLFPHLSDTLLIISGMGLLFLTDVGWHWWILMKIGLLVEYVIFASYFFHKKTNNSRHFFLALLCLSCAVLVGYYH